MGEQAAGETRQIGKSMKFFFVCPLPKPWGDKVDLPSRSPTALLPQDGTKALGRRALSGEEGCGGKEAAWRSRALGKADKSRSL